MPWPAPQPARDPGDSGGFHPCPLLAGISHFSFFPSIKASLESCSVTAYISNQDFARMGRRVKTEETVGWLYVCVCVGGCFQGPKAKQCYPLPAMSCAVQFPDLRN